NRIDTGTLTIPNELVTIYSGNYWSIFDYAGVYFTNGLTVQENAMLFVSTKSATTMSLIFNPNNCEGIITNNGIIAVNSLSSTGAPVYNLHGASFYNYGELYFAGNGNVGDTMTITTTLVQNAGMMEFYHTQRSSSYVTIGAGTTIENTGQICFRSHYFYQLTDITGNGCMTACAGSTIYISNPARAISTDQSFYLQDSLSSVVIYGSTSLTMNVYGFGNENKLGITQTLVGTTYPKFVYDEVAGTLILTGPTPTVRQTFIIGTGYDPDLFEVVNNAPLNVPSANLNSVTYHGPVPDQVLPASCQIPCKDPPVFPVDNTFPMTSVFTSTWE
ncbi:putative Hyr1-like cell wall protein, partial [Candida maltosa Xu316]